MLPPEWLLAFVTETGSALQFGTPTILNPAASVAAPEVFYDVTPDGKKILLNRVEQEVSQSVTIVTDFTAGLNK